MVNPLGTKGHVAHAFAGILMDMWKQETAYLTPINFRVGLYQFPLGARSI